MTVRTGPKAGAGHPDRWRLWMHRIVAVLMLTVLATYLVNIAVWQTHVPARLFEDWTWYGDGPARLMAGQPLYDPVLLHGPYDLADPAVMGKYNQWPALAAALMPFQAIIPVQWREPVWGVLMAGMLIIAFALVWPRGAAPLAGTALALVVAVAPPAWLAFRTANLACAVALGVALTIIGHRRRSTGLMAMGLLLAGIAKLLPAMPLVLWLLVRHREWRPVVAAVLVGAALTAIPVFLQGPSVIWDFVIASAGQMPLAEWTNVAPAYRLAPMLGSLALPVSVVAALALAAYALRPARSEGASLLLLTIASCLVISTTHLFWWLSPMVVAVAYYGNAILARWGTRFDWEGSARTRGT